MLLFLVYLDLLLPWALWLDWFTALTSCLMSLHCIRNRTDYIVIFVRIELHSILTACSLDLEHRTYRPGLMFLDWLHLVDWYEIGCVEAVLKIGLLEQNYFHLVYQSKHSLTYLSPSTQADWKHLNCWVNKQSFRLEVFIQEGFSDKRYISFHTRSDKSWNFLDDLDHGDPGSPVRTDHRHVIVERIQCELDNILTQKVEPRSLWWVCCF